VAEALHLACVSVLGDADLRYSAAVAKEFVDAFLGGFEGEVSNERCESATSSCII